MANANAEAELTGPSSLQPKKCLEPKQSVMNPETKHVINGSQKDFGRLAAFGAYCCNLDRTSGSRSVRSALLSGVLL